MHYRRILVISRFFIIFLFLFLFFFPSAKIELQANVSVIPSHPIILESSFHPTKVQPGDLVTVTATVYDLYAIQDVQATFPHELGVDVVALSLVSGSPYHGVWEAQWIVHDTIYKEYITTITAFSKSGLCSSVEVSWWDPPTPWLDIDWSYRKELNISNPVSDYQMQLVVGYDSGASSYDVHCEGHCNTNFSDLRFTASDGTTLRSYWIERKTDGDTCLVWINTSGESKIYMYYGNNNVGCQSNGNSTFLFFDDFLGTSLDTRWNVPSTNYQVSGSVLRINTGAIGLQNPLGFNFQDGHMVETKILFDTIENVYSGTIPEISSSRFTSGSNSQSDATIL